jgi:hypothetical protein
VALAFCSLDENKDYGPSPCCPELKLTEAYTTWPTRWNDEKKNPAKTCF